MFSLMHGSQAVETFYTPVCDLFVLALCYIMLFLLRQTYIVKNRGYSFIQAILGALIASALGNVLYQNLTPQLHNSWLLYALRLFHLLLLLLTQVLYVEYLLEPLWVPLHKGRTIVHITTTLAAAALIDIALSVSGWGYYVLEDGRVHNGVNIFIMLYFAFTLLITGMIIWFRSRIVRQVFWGLLFVHSISFALMLVQGLYAQISFTTAGYFIPVVGLIFLFHSNPYDVNTGTVSDEFFYREMDDYIEHHEDYIIISCTMVGFRQQVKTNPDLKRVFHRFFRVHVHKGVVYHFPGDRFILTFVKEKGKDYQSAVERMFGSFRKHYRRFGLDYKLVYTQRIPEITRSRDFLGLLEFVESHMEYNQIRQITPEDVKKFQDTSYILEQLEDINKKHDLNDPRVLVYCQPVYNLSTGTYDTAEALMRLNLEGWGMVYPDQFIPLAEQHELIHTMSIIILNKTCRAVHTLLEKRLRLRRISVNFSADDLRCDSFCEDISSIVQQNSIPYDTIAVEITESQNESDFDLMKDKILALQKLGIRIYLDDFGTGYSNFERLMEIPFDIIKFDRSMLIESGKSDESHYMVSTFADMFINLNYTILFEGVEDDSDERHCRMMRAHYLQGYKYSKPIPIEQLSAFLEPATGGGKPL